MLSPRLYTSYSSGGSTPSILFPNQIYFPIKNDFGISANLAEISSSPPKREGAGKPGDDKLGCFAIHAIMAALSGPDFQSGLHAPIDCDKSPAGADSYFSCKS
jgi:hypothetical protein